MYSLSIPSFRAIHSLHIYRCTYIIKIRLPEAFLFMLLKVPFRRQIWHALYNSTRFTNTSHNGETLLEAIIIENPCVELRNGYAFTKTTLTKVILYQ